MPPKKDRAASTSRSPMKSPKKQASAKKVSTPRKPSVSPMKSPRKGEQRVAIFSAQSLRWVCILAYICATLVSTSFIYSFAAFKLDLKKVFDWNESQLATAFTFANIGQNFVVHMGILYDSQGMFVTGAVSGMLKILGCLGMAFCVIENINSPILFGLCFLADTQATGAAIIMGQMEAQKATRDKSKTGLVGSLCTAAFGFGAVVWTSYYDSWLAPDLSSHFITSAFVSGSMLIGFTIIVPMLGGKRMTTSTEAVSPTRPVKKFEWSELQEVMKRYDFKALFASTLVSWSFALVWIAHMANVAAAAGLSNAPEVRFYFNLCGFLGRIAIGPLVDMTREVISIELYTWLTSFMTVCAVASMLISGGQMMITGAIVGGLSFGSISTLVPLMCRKMSVPLAGTLYAISKVGCMVMSTVWIAFAGWQADQLARSQGKTVCYGEECFMWTWVFILLVCTPLCLYVSAWARDSMRGLQKTGKVKKA